MHFIPHADTTCSNSIYFSVIYVSSTLCFAPYPRGPEYIFSTFILVTITSSLTAYFKNTIGKVPTCSFTYTYAGFFKY